MALSRWICVLARTEESKLTRLIDELYVDKRPKAFCALYGPRTLIEQSLERAAMIVPPKRTLISLCKDHLRWEEVFSRHPDYQLSIQPKDAGTGPAVLLSTLQIAAENPEAIVAIFPSDHFVSDDLRWVSAVREAMMWVERRPEIFVALGAEAYSPESKYSWLLPHDKENQKPPWPARLVSNPSPEKARQLFQAGGFWNTTVLIYRCDIMLRMMALLQPDWWWSLRKSLTKGSDALEMAYAVKEPFDFSRDLLESCPHRTFVLPVRQTGWSELANEEQLSSVLEQWPPKPLFFLPPV